LGAELDFREPGRNKKGNHETVEGEETSEDGDTGTDLWDDPNLIINLCGRQVTLQESGEDLRPGAYSRIGFREEDTEQTQAPSRRALCLGGFRTPDRPIAGIGHRDEMEGAEIRALLSQGRLKKSEPQRPTSALNFRDFGSLRHQIVTLKKKALTNPWQRRKK